MNENNLSSMVEEKPIVTFSNPIPITTALSEEEIPNFDIFISILEEFTKKKETLCNDINIILKSVYDNYKSCIEHEQCVILIHDSIKIHTPCDVLLDVVSKKDVLLLLKATITEIKGGDHSYRLMHSDKHGYKYMTSRL
jgi:hypothetical protein